ncbi:hypothetical protein EON82_01055 [bacterium]|nr:MAG: hypothetical protein EON82_01055 [bacterium]
MLPLAASLLFAGLASMDQAPTPQRPAWTEPHPEIPYLPKPAPRPADWLVEQPPVTPNATPEARALLKMLYRISGKHTVMGQHNYPNEQGFNTNVMAIFSGKTPAMYGTDLGFAAAGDKDSAYVRHEMVAELTKRFRAGQMITICWHEVPPTMDEPVTFRGQIQSRITDAQFNDLLTPGTPINKHWYAQLDAVAEYLKELQDAHVPVLWRPLHEINGDWFWWNGVRGDETHGTKQLFRMMFDRLVKFHGLRNLLWVWNPDRPSRADRQFVDYFPGLEYVDVLALDCYGSFEQSYYDDLNALSGGKPMAISETTNAPALPLYASEPKWAYVMRWAMDKGPGTRMIESLKNPPATPSRGPNRAEVQAMANDPRIMSLQDRMYLQAFNEVLKAAGYPAVRRPEKVPEKL